MYYQITFTLDKRIRGRYEMPHTVKIKLLLSGKTQKSIKILPEAP